jgi:hypothetical protein
VRIEGTLSSFFETVTGLKPITNNIQLSIMKSDTSKKMVPKWYKDW